MSDKQVVPEEIKKIIRELPGEYADISRATLKRWEEHAMLLYNTSGLTIKQIDDVLNALFWSAAGEFGA